MFSIPSAERLPTLQQTRSWWRHQEGGKGVITLLAGQSKCATSPQDDTTTTIRISSPTNAINEQLNDPFKDNLIEQNLENVRNGITGRGAGEQLPIGFTTGVVLTVFRKDYDKVYSAHALLALDYLRDAEELRQSSLRAAAMRLDLTEDNWRTVLREYPDGLKWVETTLGLEDVAIEAYSRVSVALRYWAMLNELRQQNFDRVESLAMLNTLFPPCVREESHEELKTLVLQNLRISLLEHIDNVEKNGSRDLFRFVSKYLQQPGIPHCWTSTRNALIEYIDLTTTSVQQADAIRHINYFQHYPADQSNLSISTRKTGIEVSFDPAKGSSTEDNDSASLEKDTTTQSRDDNTKAEAGLQMQKNAHSEGDEVFRVPVHLNTGELLIEPPVVQEAATPPPRGPRVPHRLPRTLANDHGRSMASDDRLEYIVPSNNVVFLDSNSRTTAMRRATAVRLLEGPVKKKKGRSSKSASAGNTSPALLPRKFESVEDKIKWDLQLLHKEKSPKTPKEDYTPPPREKVPPSRLANELIVSEGDDANEFSEYKDATGPAAAFRKQDQDPSLADIRTNLLAGDERREQKRIARLQEPRRDQREISNPRSPAEIQTTGRSTSPSIGSPINKSPALSSPSELPRLRRMFDSINVGRTASTSSTSEPSARISDEIGNASSSSQSISPPKNVKKPESHLPTSIPSPVNSARGAATNNPKLAFRPRIPVIATGSGATTRQKPSLSPRLPINVSSPATPNHLKPAHSPRISSTGVSPAATPRQSSAFAPRLPIIAASPAGTPRQAAAMSPRFPVIPSMATNLNKATVPRQMPLDNSISQASAKNKEKEVTEETGRSNNLHVPQWIYKIPPRHQLPTLSPERSNFASNSAQVSTGSSKSQVGGQGSVSPGCRTPGQEGKLRMPTSIPTSSTAKKYKTMPNPKASRPIILTATPPNASSPSESSVAKSPAVQDQGESTADEPRTSTSSVRFHGRALLRRMKSFGASEPEEVEVERPPMTLEEIRRLRTEHSIKTFGPPPVVPKSPDAKTKQRQKVELRKKLSLPNFHTMDRPPSRGQAALPRDPLRSSSDNFRKMSLEPDSEIFKGKEKENSLRTVRSASILRPDSSSTSISSASRTSTSSRLPSPEKLFGRFHRHKDVVITSADITEPFPSNLRKAMKGLMKIGGKTSQMSIELLDESSGPSYPRPPPTQPAPNITDSYLPVHEETRGQFQSKEHTRTWLLESARAKKRGMVPPSGEPLKQNNEGYDRKSHEHTVLEKPKATMEALVRPDRPRRFFPEDRELAAARNPGARRAKFVMIDTVPYEMGERPS